MGAKRMKDLQNGTPGGSLVTRRMQYEKRQCVCLRQLLGEG